MGTYVSQAITFFQAMVAFIQANSSVLTDFMTGSLLNVILNAVAVAADTLNAAIFNVQKQAYLSTATGTYLDLKAADYNVTRLQATPATGPMNLVKNTAAVTDIPIPAGSLITTVPASNATLLQYETLADAILTAGSTSVPVQVQCTTPGSVGNILSGTQLLLASAIPGIDGATITTDLTNGTDTETDDALRARAQESFQGLPIGTKGWYIQQAKSVAGVTAASVVSNYSGQPNGVGVYITGPNNSIPTSTLISEVQSVLNAAELMVDSPTVLAPTELSVGGSLTIKLATGVDTNSAISAVQNAIAAYENSLGLGAPSTSGWIYPSQWIVLAVAQHGVLDASNVQINGGTSPIAVSNSQLPVCVPSRIVVTPT